MGPVNRQTQTQTNTTCRTVSRCSHLDLGREFLSWKFTHKQAAKVEKSCLVRDAKKTTKTKELTCGIENWKEEQTLDRMNKTPNWLFEKTEW